MSVELVSGTSLGSCLKRSIEFFRATPEWVATESARGGKYLSDLGRGALTRLRTELESLPGADITTACELISALLAYGINVEQERF